MKYGLSLHPEKTRLLEFGRFATRQRQQRGESPPETFAFLGFTHHCGRTRQGWFKVGRQPLAKRMRTKLGEIKSISAAECTSESSRLARGFGAWSVAG